MTRAGFGLLTFLAMGGACSSDIEPPGVTVDADLSDPADAAIVVDTAIVCTSQSGTRLKRESIEPSLGAREELRIIDTLYDVECRYQAEDVGVYTCYPVQSATTTSVFYQDSNCTSALGRVTGSGDPPTFTRYVRASAMPCGAPIQEYRVLGAMSPVSGGDAVFVRNAAGACISVTAPSSGTYFVAGAALGASDFVGATTQAFSAESRVSTQAYSGSDGSGMCAPELPKVDSALSVSCENRFGADGQAYCMPVGGTSESYFSDDQCQVEASTVAVGACEAPNPSYVVADVADMCGAVTRTVTSVLAQEVTSRYLTVGANCNLQGQNTNTYYQVGEVAADSAFAALAPVREETEGRLQRLLMASVDLSAEFTGVWYDSKNDANCVFGAASDGSLRCLPSAMPEKLLYTAADCMTPITLAVEGACQQPIGYAAQPSTMGTRIFAVKTYSAPVFELVDSACTAFSGAVYERDFELAASSFLLGEIVTN